MGDNGTTISASHAHVNVNLSPNTGGSPLLDIFRSTRHIDSCHVPQGVEAAGSRPVQAMIRHGRRFLR